MQIEAGKYYRDTNGGKHGPMVNYGSMDGYPWSVEEEDFVWWSEEGSPQEETSAIELVAEWSEIYLNATSGPIRTVTRQEIVPGYYAEVLVGDTVAVAGSDLPVLAVEVGLNGALTADQLDAAVLVLQQLAGALR